MSEYYLQVKTTKALSSPAKPQITKDPCITEHVQIYSSFIFHVICTFSLSGQLVHSKEGFLI